jgi:hypothetical protein
MSMPEGSSLSNADRDITVAFDIREPINVFLTYTLAISE